MGNWRSGLLIPATLVAAGSAFGCVSHGYMARGGDTGDGIADADDRGWVVVYGDRPAPRTAAAPAPAAPAVRERPVSAPPADPPAAAEAQDGGPLDVRARVEGLDQPALRRAFLDRLAAVPGVEQVAVTGEPGEAATVTFRLAATPAALAAALSALRAPRCEVRGLVLDVDVLAIDDVPPAVAIVAPTAGATLVAVPLLVTVRADDRDVATVRVNGVPAERDAEGLWRAAVPVERDGPVALLAEAVDHAGNVGRDARQVMVDTTPPEVSAAAMVQINGKVDDPSVTVTVEGKPVAVRADGTYATVIPLPEDRCVRVVATDRHGNARTQIVDFRKP